MKSEQSRVLLPAFNIKKSGAWPEMINPQHARAEKTPKDVWVPTCASWALVQAELCLVSDKQEQGSS